MKWVEPGGPDLPSFRDPSLDRLQPFDQALPVQRGTEMQETPSVPEGKRHLLSDADRLPRGFLGPFRPSQPECRQRDAVAEREPRRVDMVDLPRPAERPFHLRRRFVRAPQMPEAPAAIKPGRDTGIVSEPHLEIAVLLRPI